MKASQLKDDEKRYNAEYILVDSFWEFHRDAFDILTELELKILLRYYPQELEVVDVFAYREDILQKDPGLDDRARGYLGRVLNSLGVALDEVL